MAVSGELRFEGSLIESPSVTSDGAHPAGVGTLKFTTTPNPKTFTAHTGVQAADIQSPGSFVQLGSIDDTIGPVKACTFFYMRTDVAMDVQITQKQSGGGSSTRIIESVKGLFVLEVDSAEAITKVEVKGPISGTCTVEWFGSGA